MVYAKLIMPLSLTSPLMRSIASPAFMRSCSSSSSYISSSEKPVSGKSVSSVFCTGSASSPSVISSVGNTGSASGASSLPDGVGSGSDTPSSTGNAVPGSSCSAIPGSLVSSIVSSAFSVSSPLIDSPVSSAGAGVSSAISYPAISSSVSDRLLSSVSEGCTSTEKFLSSSIICSSAMGTSCNVMSEVSSPAASIIMGAVILNTSSLSASKNFISPPSAMGVNPEHVTSIV